MDNEFPSVGRDFCDFPGGCHPHCPDNVGTIITGCYNLRGYKLAYRCCYPPKKSLGREGFFPINLVYPALSRLSDFGPHLAHGFLTIPRQSNGMSLCPQFFLGVIDFPPTLTNPHAAIFG